MLKWLLGGAEAEPVRQGSPGYIVQQGQGGPLHRPPSPDKPPSRKAGQQALPASPVAAAPVPGAPLLPSPAAVPIVVNAAPAAEVAPGEALCDLVTIPWLIDCVESLQGVIAPLTLTPC